MAIALGLLTEDALADAQYQINNQMVIITFDNKNQAYQFYPAGSDPATIWAFIESVRQHIVNLGFGDAAPALAVTEYSPILSDGLSTQVSTYVATSTDWAETYSLLGLEPPGSDPTPGEPQAPIDTPPDGSQLFINFDNGNQSISWNPQPGRSGRATDDIRAEIESVRARIADLGFDDATPNAEAGWFDPPMSDVEVSGYNTVIVKWAYTWEDTYAMFGLEPPTN